jgi:hypothetical protein
MFPDLSNIPQLRNPGDDSGFIAVSTKICGLADEAAKRLHEAKDFAGFQGLQHRS